MAWNPNDAGTTKTDNWKAIANDYAKKTEATSAQANGAMLEQADALWPFSEATGVLDVGCGPGPVMRDLLKNYTLPDSATLACSDFSEAMVEQVKKTKQEAVENDARSPWGRVSAEVQDAMNMKSTADSSVSHVTGGMMYFVPSDPQKALREALRVLQKDGVLACSSWQGSQWMDLCALLSRVRGTTTMPQLPEKWTAASSIEDELRVAGFRDVQCRPVDVEMEYEDLDGIVDWLIYKLPPMIFKTKDFSGDEMAQLKEMMVEEGRKMQKEQGNKLKGTALVAVGRK